MAIRIAISGLGKIARDQHIPSIKANPAFDLVAVVSRHAVDVPGVPTFTTLDAMLDGDSDVDAVAICTPPGVRHALARQALDAGLDVLLEKPPAATLGEIDDLVLQASSARRTLFATWHAQYNPAVTAAARLLAGQEVTALSIDWREDVRKWHPGQEWIWAAGGFGVFDPGINALSIATRILPMPLLVKQATLVFPANRQAPIAATLAFAGPEGALRATMDWRHEAGESWTIRIETAAGRTIELVDGGARLIVDGKHQSGEDTGEYPAIYARFAELVATRTSDVDREPLRIVADAFLVGERAMTQAFL